MSPAGSSRPSAFRVFFDSYRAFFTGFRAFIPTLVVVCLIYFLITFLAYQIDPLTAAHNSDSTDLLLPFEWTGLLFIPCAIWWHRYVWSGETSHPWKTVLSLNGGKYFLLTVFIWLSCFTFIFAVEALEAPLESLEGGAFDWAVRLAVILTFALILAMLIGILIIFIPALVSFAVGYEPGFWRTFRLIKGHFWYCVFISLLAVLPYVSLFVVETLIEDLSTSNFVVEQLAACFGLVVFDSAYACAMTIIFRWMVDSELNEITDQPVGDRG